MSDLEQFMHDEPEPTPILIKAALAHAQFETIHPFLDGNGRVGRLLMTLLLCSERVLKEPLLYLSLYFKQKPRRLLRPPPAGAHRRGVGGLAAGLPRGRDRRRRLGDRDRAQHPPSHRNGPRQDPRSGTRCGFGAARSRARQPLVQGRAPVRFRRVGSGPSPTSCGRPSTSVSDRHDLSHARAAGL